MISIIRSLLPANYCSSNFPCWQCHFSISNIPHTKSQIEANESLAFIKFHLSNAVPSENWGPKIYLALFYRICHYRLVEIRRSDATFNFQVGRPEEREAKGAKETGVGASGFCRFYISILNSILLLLCLSSPVFVFQFSIGASDFYMPFNFQLSKQSWCCQGTDVNRNVLLFG